LPYIYLSVFSDNISNQINYENLHFTTSNYDRFYRL
jgi:hypothetical protein